MQNLKIERVEKNNVDIIFKIQETLSRFLNPVGPKITRGMRVRKIENSYVKLQPRYLSFTQTGTSIFILGRTDTKE